MEKQTNETGENEINNNKAEHEITETDQGDSETKAVNVSDETVKGDSETKEVAVSDETVKGDSETKEVAGSGETVKGDQEKKDFMEMYEESLKSIQEGELVRGEIVQVDKEFVLVDIGYKSEGQIRINEFIDSEGNITARVGEKVDVLLERRENDDGFILLSKEKASEIKIWDEIREIYEKGGIVRGKIISRVKGGMSVDIGLQAFLPGSQVDLKPIRDFDSFIDTEHDFKILKYNRRRSNIVLSRRAILESERMHLRENTLKTLENGAALNGTVKNITEYGLFIDLGGIDGLLHITDMSWGRVGHPSEMFQVGDEITVKVLSFDREKGRVSLGLKQLKSDPWTNADEKYAVGTKIRGRVMSLADYGAFVEVEEGIEGLIHVSEMSWTRKVRHPSQVLKVGDFAEVMVLNIDSANKRISLGLKQVEPNPWEIIGEKYPVGTTIEGRVKNITDFGIFIGIDEGIDGLVHISDISWIKRIKHPSELYKKGQEVQAVVLNIDEGNERFSLGIKQLTTDPWDEAPEKYKTGTRITGMVTNVTDFGVFVELEEGIEGLIHVSELSKDKSGNPLSRFKVDDVIQARVINVLREDKKIGLSIKKLEEGNEKNVYKSYLENHNEATSNLGEILKKGMLDLQDQRPSDDQESGESMETHDDEERPSDDQESGESMETHDDEERPSNDPSVETQAEKIETL